MTTITEQDLKKLAELAKLDLDIHPDNTVFKNKLIADLNNILNLVGELQSIDTSNIQPMVHADPQAKQRLRPDVVTEENIRDIIQKIAPPHSVEAGLYLVPQVIEN